jgi:hypothetical protein
MRQSNQSSQLTDCQKAVLRYVLEHRLKDDRRRPTIVAAIQAKGYLPEEADRAVTRLTRRRLLYVEPKGFGEVFEVMSTKDAMTALGLARHSA